jgi:hypothetical protein
VILVANHLVTAAVRTPVDTYGRLVGREVGALVLGVGLFCWIARAHGGARLQAAFLRALALVMVCLAGVHVVDALAREPAFTLQPGQRVQPRAQLCHAVSAGLFRVRPGAQRGRDGDHGDLDVAVEQRGHGAVRTPAVRVNCARRFDGLAPRRGVARPVP